MSLTSMSVVLIGVIVLMFGMMMYADHREHQRQITWWQTHSIPLVSGAPVTAVVAHEAHWKMGPYVDWVRVETADIVVILTDRALGCGDQRTLVGPGAIHADEEITPLQALRGRTLKGVTLRVPQAADTFVAAECPELTFRTNHWEWHGKTVAMLNPLAW